METTVTALPSFEDESRALARRQTMVACWLTLALGPLYAVPDYFLYPEAVSALWTLRLSCWLGAIMILWAAHGRMGERYPGGMGLGLGYLIAVTGSSLPAYVVGFDTPYFMGTVLVILTMAILLPLSVRQAVVLPAMIAVTHGAVGWVKGDVGHPWQFVTQLALIGTAACIALVSMRVGAEMRQQEYAGRAALRAASDEKSGLIRRLQDKTTTLERLNQDMEDVLYVASHDLRAPLINVQGFAREVQLGLADLRAGGLVSPEAKAIHADIDESLRFILTAVSRMDALIEALLNVSRIGTRTSPTDEVPLGGMVEKIVESFRYQLDEKRIDVEVERLPSVVGDPVRLNQVFSNLIDNAIKYMGDSSRRRIEIGVRNGDTPPRFFVRDTGPGIPPDSHETVFRLFRRLGADVPGEGLGLTMVRKIVEKHGGRIWVESAIGEGSTFWFTLPGVGVQPR